MELAMCRMCLAKNVRMYTIINTELQSIYEKLTEILFEKKASPVLVCYICCAQLRYCRTVMRKCLEAESILAQVSTDDQFCLSDKQVSVLRALSVCELRVLDVAPSDYPEIPLLPAVQVKVEPLDSADEDVSSRSHDKDGVRQQMPRIDSMTVTVKMEAETDSPPAPGLVDDEQVPALVQSHGVVHNNTLNWSVPSGLTVGHAKIKKPNHLHSQQRRKNMNQNNFVDCNVVITTDGINTSPEGTNNNPQITDKPFKCQLCQLSFTRKYSLNRHNRVHTGEKPYTCDICHRSFRQSNALHYHIRTHSGEKLFKCDVCQSSFSRKDYLYSHMRIHTGARPYTCDVCHRSFSQKVNLDRHVSLHSGEKPFKCEACPNSFSRKSVFKRHLLKHVKIDLVEENLSNVEPNIDPVEERTPQETVS